MALARFALIILGKGAIFPFGYMVPFMIMAGTSVGLSLTPLSHGLLSSEAEEAAGEASGLSNTARELGGVFGVAIGGLVFASGGTVTTPDDFGHHLVPALFVFTALLVVGLLSVAVLVRGAREETKSPIESGSHVEAKLHG